jgi:hypothetical protein
MLIKIEEKFTINTKIRGRIKRKKTTPREENQYMFNIFTYILEKQATNEPGVCGLCHTATTHLHPAIIHGRHLNLCEDCCYEFNVPIEQTRQNVDNEQVQLLNASPTDRSKMLTQMALNYAYRK